MTNIYSKKLSSTEYAKWSITLTLDPKLCSFLSHIEQYEYTLPILIDRIKSGVLFKAVNVSFELTQKKWIHIHMAIETNLTWTIKTMRNQLDILFKGPDSIFGFYFLTPCTDWNGWISYINKNPYQIEKYKYAF